MRIRNSTDLPDTLIRDLVRVVTPPGVVSFDVRVTNARDRRARGVAYHEGHGSHDRPCPFVIVRVPRTDTGSRFTFNAGVGRRRRKGYLTISMGSRAEVLVVLLAHELRHLWQARVKRGRRVWGSRGQFSERDADAYALRALRRFRRGTLWSGVEGHP